MQFTKEQRELIEKIIRENEKFQGREDLLESFCAEVYKKSYLLLDSVSNIENLKNYLAKVADTSITNVLNDIKGQKKISPPQAPEPVSDLPKSIREDRPYRAVSSIQEGLTSLKASMPEITSIKNVDVFKDIKDPAESVRQESLSKNMAQKMVNIIYEIHKKVPSKHYFHIFYLKHIKLKKQAEIANKLGITQNELSKRYWELVKLVKDNF